MDGRISWTIDLVVFVDSSVHSFIVSVCGLQDGVDGSGFEYFDGDTEIMTVSGHPFQNSRIHLLLFCSLTIATNTIWVHIS